MATVASFCFPTSWFFTFPSGQNTLGASSLDRPVVPNGKYNLAPTVRSSIFVEADLCPVFTSHLDLQLLSVVTVT